MVMAVKGKKGKQGTQQQELKKRRWPLFPQAVIKSIARDSILMRHVTFGGVTKSWRASSICRRCNASPAKPQLCEIDNGRKGDMKFPLSPPPPNEQQIFNISFYQGYFWPFGRWSPGYRDPWSYFVGCSNGIVVAGGYDPSDYYLIYPGTFSSYHVLPPWDPRIQFKFVALSSSPTNPNGCNVVVLTGVSRPAFLSYTSKFPSRDSDKYAWTREDCTIVDPHSSDQQQLMQFTHVVGSEGKFYALSLQGTLAVIEEVEDCSLKITSVSKSSSLGCFFTTFQRIPDGIERGGLVGFPYLEIVDDVEIFRLDSGRLSWVKMVDRALIAGQNCGMCVGASKVGCRRNCVYFTSNNRNEADEWWVFDLETHCFSPVSCSSLGWDDESMPRE